MIADTSVHTQREHLRRTVSREVRFVLVALLGLAVFTPFILAFLGSFKSGSEIIEFPPSFLPATWLWQNWVDLFSTDFGGTPRPAGTTSLGVVTGVITFFVTFLLTATSTSEKARPDQIGMRLGLASSVAIIVASSYAVSWYLQRSFEASVAVRLSTSIAVAFVGFFAIAVVSMSSPSWQDVIPRLLRALLLGAIVTVAVTMLAQLAGGGRFARWFFNTAMLSTSRAVIQVMFSSMAAYAFARLEFRGKNFLYTFMLASMMLPGAVTLIPAYVLIAKIGWVNTYYSLVFPSIVVTFGIFLLTQFLKSVPKDLEEAAKIDGATHYQIYRHIMLPLSRPALVTLFILQFQAMWNDFLTPLLYLNTADMWVLNVALEVFKQAYVSQVSLILVGAMVNAIPVLILFTVFSRYYIEGVAYSGMKG